MKYKVYLGRRAKKQYKRLNDRIQKKIKEELLELEEEPYKKGFFLSGRYSGLRYLKISHAGVQYRAVYDMSEEREILVLYLGTRENFYKELRRYLG